MINKTGLEASAVVFLLVLQVVASPEIASSESVSYTASPGDFVRFGVAESACPTFSWAAADGASLYELVVFAAEDTGSEPSQVPALERALRGQVTSWSPSLEECLEPGGRYGWSIRARVGELWTPWSKVRFFQAPAVESVALEAKAKRGDALVETPVAGQPQARRTSDASRTVLSADTQYALRAEIHGSGDRPLVAVYGRASYDFHEGKDYLAGYFDGTVRVVNGTLYADSLIAESQYAGSSHVYGTTNIFAALGPSPYPLCMELNNGGVLKRCTSSRRFKEGIRPLELEGLATLNRLEPVQFRWTSGESDLGFIAEEVAAVDPLLATFGEKGEVEGVKYWQLTAVLVKALQEQRAEFDTFREQYEREIGVLRRRLEEAAIGSRCDSSFGQTASTKPGPW